MADKLINQNKMLVSRIVNLLDKSLIRDRDLGAFVLKTGLSWWEDVLLGSYVESGSLEVYIEQDRYIVVGVSLAKFKTKVFDKSESMLITNEKEQVKADKELKEFEEFVKDGAVYSLRKRAFAGFVKRDCIPLFILDTEKNGFAVYGKNRNDNLASTYVYRDIYKADLEKEIKGIPYSIRNYGVFNCDITYKGKLLIVYRYE